MTAPSDRGLDQEEFFERRKIILLLDRAEMNIIVGALERSDYPQAERIKKWFKKCWDMNLKPESPWSVDEVVAGEGVEPSTSGL